MVNFENFSIFFMLFNYTAGKEASTFGTERGLIDFLEEWTLSETEEDYLKGHSKFVKQLMNVSADPCQDFYQFACGNFNSALPCDSAGRYGDFFDIVYSFGDFLIERAVINAIGDDRRFDLGNHMFLSCMHENGWRPRSNEQFLREFAAWPFFDLNWERNYYLEKLTAEARSYSFQIFFEHQMKVVNGDLIHRLQPLWQNVADLDELLKISALIGVDLEDKKGDLYNTIVFASDLNDLANDYKEGIEGDVYDYIQLSEISQYFSFQEYFTRFYSRVSQETTDFKTYIIHPEYFRKLDKLIAATDPKIVANFVFAQILRGLYPLRPDVIFGENLKEGCVNLVKSYLYVYHVKYLSPIKNVQNMADMQYIKSLTTTIQDVVYKHFKEELKGEPNRKKHRALSKIFNMKMEILYPLTDEVLVVMERHKPHISHDDFYGNYLRLMKFQNQLLLKNVDNSYATSNHFSDFLDGTGVRVPISVLLPPFYHHNAPDYVKYGALGTFISQQFSVEMSEYIGNRSYLGCIDSSSLSADVYNQTDIDKICAARKGVQLAVYAYKKRDSDALRTNPVVEELPPYLSQPRPYPPPLYPNFSRRQFVDPMNVKVNGIVMDGIRGLYLTYAQTMCSKKDKLSNIVRHQYFWDSPDFNLAFNCRRDV